MQSSAGHLVWMSGLGNLAGLVLESPVLKGIPRAVEARRDSASVKSSAMYLVIEARPCPVQVLSFRSTDWLQSVTLAHNSFAVLRERKCSWLYSPSQHQQGDTTSVLALKKRSFSLFGLFPCTLSKLPWDSGIPLNPVNDCM